MEGVSPTAGGQPAKRQRVLDEETSAQEGKVLKPPNGDKARQRVSKACDQCRRRRVKCEAYPDAEQDAPCVICTDAGTAAGCTFTRPRKKRGPQAGYAKSLVDTISAYERLLGHLILLHPPILALCDTFFGSDCSTSTSAQTTAFNESSLPNQLEAFHLKARLEQPSPEASVGPSSSSIPQRKTPNSGRVLSAEDSISVKDPWSSPSMATASFNADNLSIDGAGITGATSPLPSLLHQSGEASTPSAFANHASLTMATPSYFNDADHGGLQTLANAAVTNYSDYYGSYGRGNTIPSEHVSSPRAMEVEGPALSSSSMPLFKIQGGEMHKPLASETSSAPSPRTGGPSPASAPPIPTLPTESIRNQLLDIYFNQVVHPSFPMLDKSRFFRWSADLPAQNVASSTALSTLPPELFLSVYAVAVPYLLPASANLTHRVEIFADAGRNHLYYALRAVTLETVQACVLLALSDWGQGEMDRAWALSCLSIALSVNLSLHLSDSANTPAPNSTRLMTFHSALILQTLLSVRLSRPAIIVLEDYDIPLPPVDGPENLELWRSDKSPAVLRADRGVPHSPRSSGRPDGQTHAVRSCALSTFSKLSSLCAIGVSIVRWDVCPRRGNGKGLSKGEQERQELVNSLLSWEQDLPLDLRLSELARGVDKVGDRSRHVIELHLVLFSLYLRLTPHSSFASAHNPVPQALALLTTLITQYRDLFSFLRSLPCVEAVIHDLSQYLFRSPEYNPQQHDPSLKAYEELSVVFPVARSNCDALKNKVDEHRRELGLIRGIHPTPSLSSSLLSPSSCPAGTGAPFQAFLNYSNDLGSAADPSTILDFGSWDQSDLLVSLGLVSGGGGLSGWGSMSSMPAPAVDASSNTMPMQLVEASGDGFSFAVQGAGLETSEVTMEWPQSPILSPEQRPSAMLRQISMQQQRQPTDLLSCWLERGGLDGDMGEG